VLALAPNSDPGSFGIQEAIKQASPGVQTCEHLPRERFLSILHRVDALVGNSSAGLIEAAVIGCPAINIGIRQEGRERASNVMDLGETSSFDVQGAIERARKMTRSGDHPYGDGRCGQRVAETLASVSLALPPRKCNSY
jgi:UDP-N-acetylglucosamine 2-epimerase